MRRKLKADEIFNDDEIPVGYYNARILNHVSL